MHFPSCVDECRKSIVITKRKTASTVHSSTLITLKIRVHFYVGAVSVGSPRDRADNKIINANANYIMDTIYGGTQYSH